MDHAHVMAAESQDFPLARIGLGILDRFYRSITNPVIAGCSTVASFPTFERDEGAESTGRGGGRQLASPGPRRGSNGGNQNPHR